MKGLVLVIALLSSVVIARLADASSQKMKVFSEPVISVWDRFPNVGDGQSGFVGSIPSPDGKRELLFPSSVDQNDGDHYTIFAVSGDYRYPLRLDGYVQPNVIWAKDSSAALLFFSNGGANCCYETKLISFQKAGVSLTNPTRQAAEDFIAYRDKLGIHCEVSHEYPNLYGIAFLDRSHALIVAETVGHSICDCFGSIRVYEIELPSGIILKRYNQAQAKKLLNKHLPWDLDKAPNDNWDNDPKRCALKH